LSENTVPTLIIHGDRDPLAPYGNALYMEKQIANATLVTIRDGGHGGFTGEQARHFTDAVDEFIQSVTQDRK